MELSVYNGNDPAALETPPGIAFEVDPNVAAPDYSSLVFVPPVPAAGERNIWLTYDADSIAPVAGQSGWFFTGATGGATGCTLATPCSWAQVKAAAPAAVVTFSFGVTKGTDNAFTGAVDRLRLNNTIYDFEETGVIARAAS